MLPTVAHGEASMHALDNRLTTRSMYLRFLACFFALAISLPTVFLWRSDVDDVLTKTSLWFGLHTSGASNTPKVAPGPPHLQLPVTESEPSLLVAPNPPADTYSDPTELPGWREGTKWVTNNPDVQMHHWLGNIMDGNGNGLDLEWSRNKTVFLLGDSVLREWLFTLCDKFVDGHRNRLTFNEAKGVEEKNEGWECVIPSTGTRFINGFLFGMSNFSKYPSDSPILTENFPVGPWLMEERIPYFVEQYAGYEVDMVVLNSGAWDMLTMYRRDLLDGNRNDDISRPELTEFGERLRECMHLVKAAWPSSKHTFLHMQPFRSNDTMTRWIWAQTLAHSGGYDWGLDFGAIVTPSQSLETIAETLPPLFTRRRVSQLATTYRRVVKEENWDSVDFWKIAEASETDEFYPLDDPVHPTVPTTQVVMDFILEKLWRWETLKV